MLLFAFMLRTDTINKLSFEKLISMFIFGQVKYNEPPAFINGSAEFQEKDTDSSQG